MLRHFYVSPEETFDQTGRERHFQSLKAVKVTAELSWENNSKRYFVVRS